MTVELARKILGNSSNKYSDEKLQEIINCFEVIIEMGFSRLEANINEAKHNCLLKHEVLEPIMYV